MKNRNVFISAATLIESVLTNEMPPEDALAIWPDLPSGSSKTLDQAWTRLRHFADDADIHATDSDYFRSECEELLESMSELKLAGNDSDQNSRTNQ